MPIAPRSSAVDSPDVEDLDCWLCPSEPTSILLELSVGPADDEDGADLFAVTVCNLAWLADRADDRPIGLRHHVLVSPGTSFGDVRQYLETRVNACTAGTWQAVAERVGRFAAWEFEDYQD
ncbi:Imm8 family immunity protein [Patulibacter minatonensis]|uniref:Imm8 family immunity protein n=1 Tax=Patulibacter minatonensis TaxID=298163 RepID=UPI00146FA09F|nr:Imm8 family immunity protein [Patulibacter minatonensis]